MDVFDILSLIGGLSLFLFGMNLMGEALERRAGSGLRNILGRLTTGKFAGLLTGLGITSIIQSSSATTVMVVGFVNSGIMSLKQAINVIMGANIGTTVTAWILSLAGIDSDNMFVNLLKPTSFTPVLALIGIILYMFYQNDKKRDTGVILLGFATLMFGMEAMSTSVSGLADVPQFQQLFLAFTNPFLGVAAGAILTAIIQSSSASVGILQALAMTGQVTYGAAVPIIMGQNIGTCVTALISSVSANRNAKRAALVHLSFNVIGTIVWLAVFCIVKAAFAPFILTQSASLMGIAIIHSAFNIACTIILFPMSSLLEKLVYRLLPAKGEETEKETQLDTRLLTTPSLALDQCKRVMEEMAGFTNQALVDALGCVENYDEDKAANVIKLEKRTDRYEDMLGTYLVELSTRQISVADSETAAEYLKLIGDFERITDHSRGIIESMREMREKHLTFSKVAVEEFAVFSDAVYEIVDMTYKAFINNDIEAAARVKPLDEVIERLKSNMRTNHILRMQKGVCSIEVGFIWSDIMTSLERVAGHCANIAVCIIDTANHNMNMHELLRTFRGESEEFKDAYRQYAGKYGVTTR